MKLERIEWLPVLIQDGLINNSIENGQDLRKSTICQLIDGDG
jgi:hypothetical protein